MSSRPHGLFDGEDGDQLAAQSLVRKLLTSGDTSGNAAIDHLIQNKKVEVLMCAVKIIQAQMQELLPPMEAIKKTAQDLFPSVDNALVQSELTRCYSATRNNSGQTFVSEIPELQDEVRLQSLKECATKLVPLAEQAERLAAVMHNIENKLGDAALHEKLNAESESNSSFRCQLL